MRRFALVSATLLLVASARPTRAIHLDPTFGTGGKVLTDFDAGSDAATAVVVQSDGKIVAGGTTLMTSLPLLRRFALARYDVGGILDPTFGSGGRVVTAVGDEQFAPRLHALAVQPDGKLLAMGETVCGEP